MTHQSTQTNASFFTRDDGNEDKDTQQKIELRYESMDCLDDNKGLLSTFVAHNQSLKRLEVQKSWDMSHEFMAEMCGQLSRLTQLRELTLCLPLMSGQNSLSESLRTIGVNCKLLKRLALVLITRKTPLNGQTLDPLGCYRRLKRLDLTITAAVDEEVLEPLKLCHRLKHLAVFPNRISDKYLSNCDKQWPRLQYLNVCFNYNSINAECLSHLSRLPALQTLVINYNGSDCLNDNDLNAVLSSSPNLKTIEIRQNLAINPKIFSKK